MLNNLQKEGQQLALTRRLLFSHAPLMAALGGYLRGDCGSMTLILDERERGRRLTGCVQMRSRPDAGTCEIVFIAPAADGSDAAQQIWQRLITAACRYAGEHNKQRVIASVVTEVYAPLPVNALMAGAGTLRQRGFDVYAQETLYYCPVGTYPAAPRTQSPPQNVHVCTAKDRVVLDALYTHAAPRTARQVEPSLWTEFGDSSGVHFGSGQEEDYVAEVKGKLVGLLRVVWGRTGYWLKVLTHPEHSDYASRLVEQGLRVLAQAAPLPIYCSVRDYEAGTKPALEAHGFQPLARQDLLVKHLAVWVKGELPIPVQAQVKPQAQPANAVLRKFRALCSTGYQRRGVD